MGCKTFKCFTSPLETTHAAENILFKCDNVKVLPTLSYKRAVLWPFVGRKSPWDVLLRHHSCNPHPRSLPEVEWPVGWGPPRCHLQWGLRKEHVVGASDWGLCYRICASPINQYHTRLESDPLAAIRVNHRSPVGERLNAGSVDRAPSERHCSFYGWDASEDRRNAVPTSVRRVGPFTLGLTYCHPLLGCKQKRP